MQFVFQPLTWGFLLALLPLLIHLINLMRQKRVKWAAMEFLLASHKKHRQWVWLKQFLLLLARMAAIILAVAMLAQLKTRNQWLDFLGGKPTHYYVLLDDSYSMSERVSGASAFDGAKQVLRTLASRAKNEDSPQKITLLRFSQARSNSEKTGDVAGSAPAVAVAADFSAEPMDGSFDVTLEKKQRDLSPTDLSLSPIAALTVLKRWLGESGDENRRVYLLSDFRQHDWESPAETRALLEEVRKVAPEIHFVNCSLGGEQNLGIVDLVPADDTRGAGVPLFIDVMIKNFGPQVATKVQVKLQSQLFPASDAARTDLEKLQVKSEELETILIDKIENGETVTRRVQVYFAQPGKHVVEALLPDDSLAADNRRWCVIDLPAGEKVLIVDGSAEPRNGAYYLEAAFRPQQRSSTGILSDVKTSLFLRDASLDALRPYAAIYLLDVPLLDERAVGVLEEYVKGGGGLAFFAGPQTNIEFFNRRFYAAGAGLLPAPLGGEGKLTVDLSEEGLDFEFSKHPVFNFFLEGSHMAWLRDVKVDTYRQVASDWTPPTKSGVDVIARLRDGSPLMIEKTFGQGHVVMFQSTLAPQWNDFAKNPLVVVFFLRLQAYLASPHRLDDPRLVGAPLDVSLDKSKYRPEVTFVLPGERENTRQKIDRTAVAQDSSSGMLVATLGKASAAATAAETFVPGIYEAWPTTTKGEIDLQRWALNVYPPEGELKPISPADLLVKLDSVKIQFHDFDQFDVGDVGGGGQNLGQWLMAALVALLLGEQWLALSASYLVAGGTRS